MDIDGSKRGRPHCDTPLRGAAAELGIPFLDKGAAPPVEHRRALIDSLAAIADSPGFDDEALEAMTAYWRGDTAGVERRLAASGRGGDAMLAANELRLIELGHYNSATLHYAGEWYWGVDRLGHLGRRMQGLGVRPRSYSSQAGRRICFSNSSEASMT